MGLHQAGTARGIASLEDKESLMADAVKADPLAENREGLEYNHGEDGEMQDVDLGEVPEKIIVTPAPQDLHINGGLIISDLHHDHERRGSTVSVASDNQQPPPLPEKDQTFPTPGPVANDGPNGASAISSPSAGRPSTETGNDVPKAKRSAPLSSIVFVVSALEQIVSSKESRKKKALAESASNALAAIKRQDAALDPETIFEPLRLATETPSIPLATTALDCIGKLISYSYFSIPAPIQESTSAPSQQQQTPPLIERAIETICDCFQDEATPAEIQLQIVKSLLAAVLNDKIIVHGSGLLKAVRQVYNIFLLSKSPVNQQIAQGTLTQMVGTVFERVTNRLSMKEARMNISKLASEKGTANTSQVELNGNISLHEGEHGGATECDETSEAQSLDAPPSDQPVRKEPREKLTLQSFENAKSFDDAKIGDNAPTMVTQAKAPPPRTVSGQQLSVNGDDDQGTISPPDEDEEDEIYVKDAFLVFRSMCRLSTKTLGPDQQQDIKSGNMRSKLVSLAIIRTLLNNHMIVFTSPMVVIRSSTNNEPTSFGQAINQYLRLSLSKNGASAARQVFECCCEIFWLMVKDMRVMLKVCLILDQS